MELLGWSSAWVWELCSNSLGRAKRDKVVALGGSEGLLDWEGRAVCALRPVVFLGSAELCRPAGSSQPAAKLS